MFVALNSYRIDIWVAAEMIFTSNYNGLLKQEGAEFQTLHLLAANIGDRMLAIAC